MMRRPTRLSKTVIPNAATLRIENDPCKPGRIINPARSRLRLITVIGAALTSVVLFATASTYDPPSLDPLAVERHALKLEQDKLNQERAVFEAEREKERAERKQFLQFKETLSDWIQLKSTVKITPEQRTGIINLVLTKSIEHNLDPLLVLSVIQVESQFNTRAVSPAGAQGLMQVMPGVHADKLKGRDPRNPKVGVEVGTKVLSDYLAISGGKLDEALKRYNGSLALHQAGNDYVRLVRVQLSSIQHWIVDRSAPNRVAILAKDVVQSNLRIARRYQVAMNTVTAPQFR